jgi:hypothetical protein
MKIIDARLIQCIRPQALIRLAPKMLEGRLYTIEC